MQKIKFDSEKQRYTVQARNDRFVIMTKPFNAQKTYLYTIADMDRLERGPCNLIFGLPCDVDTPEGAQEALSMIEAGDMEVSHRKCVPLSDAEIAQINGRLWWRDVRYIINEAKEATMPREVEQVLQQLLEDAKRMRERAGK